MTEIVEVTPVETVSVSVAPKETPERDTVVITFAPKPTEVGPSTETVEIVFEHKPEEATERDTVEITFAPKSTEEAPKPELTEVALAPKPTEDTPSEITDVELKPTPKTTAIWEAPEDFEIVIEKFHQVKEVPEETDTTTVEVTTVVTEEGTYPLHVYPYAYTFQRIFLVK